MGALSFGLVLMWTGGAAAQASDVTSVPPFIGTNSETWERFGVSIIPNGTAILGGIATISGDHILTQKSFTMCTVLGKPRDGMILMDSDRPSGPLTISFSQPVSAFGAYWGSGLGCYGDPPSILTFQDVNGNVVGSDSFVYNGDGTLLWHGYTFSKPVKTITRMAGDGEEGVAIDGLQATVASAAASLANLSTRLSVLTGDNASIAGFILTGPDPKKILIRGLGPSLPLAGALADPTLELHHSSTLLASNDNWKDTQQTAIEATGIPPFEDLESAIVQTLPANGAAYTAIMRGKNNSTGTGLIELYDLSQSANAKMANISTRGFVDLGDDVMIGGFIITGETGSVTVLIRGLGPSLPVTGALADPTLELVDGNGDSLASNDNWKDTEEADIAATGIPPSNDLESGIVRTLTAGNYTVILRGQSNTTGIGLVEVYNLQ